MNRYDFVTGALDGTCDHDASPAGLIRRHAGRHEDNRRADRLTNKTKSPYATDLRREACRVHSEARPLLAARRKTVPYTPALSRVDTPSPDGPARGLSRRKKKPDAATRLYQHLVRS